MKNYDVKAGDDLKAHRDITLLSFRNSLDDALRNEARKNGANLPNEFDLKIPIPAINLTTKLDKNLNVPNNETEKVTPKSTCSEWLRKRVKRSFTKKLLYRRLPILDWLPNYQKDYIVSDLVAGLTVGLTVIPQAIAYANVAGIPLQYGLYSSFMACFFYTIMGSCKDVAVGPTAIAAILTRETLQKSQLGPDFAVLLSFISGCVCLLMGILQLGFLIDFISGPVSVGFTSAAAIIIATSQVKDVLGLNITGSAFTDVWQNVFQHIGELKLWDTLLGLTCIVFIFMLKKLKDVPAVANGAKSPSALKNMFLKSLWLLSTSRNIVIVVVCAVLSWFLEQKLGSPPVSLTGNVKPGLPNFQPPPFQTVHGNETFGFIDMISTMGSGCIVVPLIGILETISISKVFSEGKPTDATQEMLAIGTCNVVSSFVSSMPIAGSLSRGAVNHASGVRTTLGGIYTGIMVILSLKFLTPYLFYIPKASLAAVIIAAVVSMVELQVIKPMWRTKKIDLVPGIATFLCCLFIKLELGIVIGIGVNLLFLLYASARPTLHVHKVVGTGGFEYLVITPDRSLVFPSVEYVRAAISKHGTKHGTSVPVIVDSTHIQAADFTAAKGIKTLIEDFAKRGQPLIFYNLKPSVVAIFRGVKPLELRCCFSEAELHDCLKEFANDSRISRH